MLTSLSNDIDSIDANLDAIQVLTNMTYVLQQGTINTTNGSNGSSLSINRARTDFLHFDGDKMRITPKDGFKISGRVYYDDGLGAFESSGSFTTDYIEYTDSSKYYRVVISEINGADIPIDSLPDDVITITCYSRTDRTLSVNGKIADAGVAGKRITAIENTQQNIVRLQYHNLSVKGIWAQRGYGNDGWISTSASTPTLRIHTTMSLIRGEHYVIEWDNTLVPSFMGYDANYNTIGWLTSTVDSLKIVSEDITTLDFDKMFEALPSVYYVALSCKKADNSAIDPNDYNMIRIYSDTERYNDGYTFKVCDFSTGKYSMSDSLVSTLGSKTYVISPRLKVSTGDVIVIDNTDDNVKHNAFLLPSDDDVNNPYIKGFGSYTGNRILRVPYDCYLIFNITTVSGGNITPNIVSASIKYIKRGSEYDLENINLLNQARHTDSGASLLTLMHYSDNHGVMESLNTINDFYKENQSNIDDIINTGDNVYYYYGYSVDDALVSDYDENHTYSIGDYTVFNGILYMCSAETTGSFVPESWSQLSSEVTQYSSRDEYLSHELAGRSLAVIGNHDTCLRNYNTSTGTSSYTNKWYSLPKEKAYSTYIEPFIVKWNITHSGTNIYYYKDYSSQKIRIVAIDMAYWDSNQKTWLASTLASARDLTYSVILISHSVLGAFVGNRDTAFTNLQSPDTDGTYASTSTGVYGTYVSADACEVLAQYKDIIICSLCGHAHRDRLGYTILDNSEAKQLLTIQIDQSGAARSIYNSARVYGTPSKYLFNILTFDTTLKIIKIIRIGCDYDDYLRRKKTLCINYETGEIIH